jgi:hypothetical protein
MLDIHAGATASPNSPTPPIEYFTIQLMPLTEGGISASLRSTTFDETDFDLIDQDIANVRLSTLDELVELIRAHVRIGNQPSAVSSQLS